LNLLQNELVKAKLKAYQISVDVSGNYKLISNELFEHIVW